MRFLDDTSERDHVVDLTAWWFVEVLLDTGQVLTSELNGMSAAARIADEMRMRWSTCMVTMINATTGEAIRHVGVNVWAAAGGRWNRGEGQLIAEICG